LSIGGGDIKPLSGKEEIYRCGVGRLRVIYVVDLEKRVVKIFAVLPRGDAY